MTILITGERSALKNTNNYLSDEQIADKSLMMHISCSILKGVLIKSKNPPADFHNNAREIYCCAVALPRLLTNRFRPVLRYRLQELALSLHAVGAVPVRLFLGMRRYKIYQSQRLI